MLPTLYHFLSLRFFLLLCSSALIGLPCAGQAPTLHWDRTLGGNQNENLGALIRTRDGGTIIGGQSFSDLSGELSEPSRGNGDIWVVKLDVNGILEWQRRFGGNENEGLSTIQQTADGGYILGAISMSGASSYKSEPNYGDFDYWIVKLDANGTRVWDRSFGGSAFDLLTALRQTPDGGYIVAGASSSGISGNKTTPTRGSNDFWLLKLDGTGAKQWERSYGGGLSDEVYALLLTADGGYALGGHSASEAGFDKSQRSQGGADYWLLKLDAMGQRQWDRTFGGSSNDFLYAMQQTPDGGYVLGGHSASPVSGDKSQPNQGDFDYWVVKLDGQGTKQWERALGGAQYEHLRDLVVTTDGGYVVSGLSASGVSGDKTQPSRGGRTDAWVVKLDAQGLKQWDLTLGGSGNESHQYLVQHADGTYTAAGSSNSGVSGDKSEPSRGDGDFWVVKLGPSPAVSITGDIVFCTGDKVRLTATTSIPASTYRWSTGATTASVEVSQSGTYTVQTTFPRGPSVSASHVVTARPRSTAFSLGPDSVFCEGYPVVLRASLPAVAGLTYRWSDGSTGSTLTVHRSGIYALTITGCDAHFASRRLDGVACPVVIPNIITPNGDRLNERFAPQGLGPGTWALTVYNRWGQRVYIAEAYRNDWGEKAAPGMYFYLLRQSGGATVSYKGWLEVKR